MADKNGTMKIMRIIALAVTIILAFTGYIVANDLKRQAGDKEGLEKIAELREDFNQHIIVSEKQHYEYAMKQQSFNGDMMVLMKGVAKDVERISG